MAERGCGARGSEVQDFWTATHTQTPINRMGMRSEAMITEPGAKLTTIYPGDLYGKSNYQDFGRYADVDLSIMADAEATLLGVDRSLQEADHAGSQERHDGTRREASGSIARRPRT